MMEECEMTGSLKPNKNSEANIKAYVLLKETIGDDNFMNLVANKTFTIKGKYGIYSINMLCKVNLYQDIVVGPKIRPVSWSLCIGSENRNLPEGDRIVSLYLAITNDEENFIKNANFRNVDTIDEFNQRSYNNEDGDEDTCEPCSSPSITCNSPTRRG